MTIHPNEWSPTPAHTSPHQPTHVASATVADATTSVQRTHKHCTHNQHEHNHCKHKDPHPQYLHTQPTRLQHAYLRHPPVPGPPPAHQYIWLYMVRYLRVFAWCFVVFGGLLLVLGVGCWLGGLYTGTIQVCYSCVTVLGLVYYFSVI
jgi:hypothetical protein